MAYSRRSRGRGRRRGYTTRSRGSRGRSRRSRGRRGRGTYSIPRGGIRM